MSKIKAKTTISAGIYPIDNDTNTVTNPTVQGSAIVSEGIEYEMFLVDDVNDLIFFGRMKHPNIGEAVLGVSKEVYSKWFEEIVESQEQ